MSDDETELKGRLEIVEAQRNDALNRNVLLGGQLKVLLAKRLDIGCTDKLHLTLNSSHIMAEVSILYKYFFFKFYSSLYNLQHRFWSPDYFIFAQVNYSGTGTGSETALSTSLNI